MNRLQTAGTRAGQETGAREVRKAALGEASPATSWLGSCSHRMRTLEKDQTRGWGRNTECGLGHNEFAKPFAGRRA